MNEAISSAFNWQNKLYKRIIIPPFHEIFSFAIY